MQHENPEVSGDCANEIVRLPALRALELPTGMVAPLTSATREQLTLAQLVNDASDAGVPPHHSEPDPECHDFGSLPALQHLTVTLEGTTRPGRVPRIATLTALTELSSKRKRGSS